MEASHRFIILAVLIGAVGIGLGVIIGYFSRGDASRKPPSADPSVSQMVMNEIKASNIEENLRILTENPHIAGRDVDEVDLVNFIKSRWESSGIEVEIHPYKVLLSYPDQDDSNYLAIKTIDGNLTNRSHPTEAILDPSQNKSGVVNPFSAYSASGDPEGDLVYVNYGTIQDFIEISQKINLTDKICMARYGTIFRGDKAAHAEQYNCAGLILYSDPGDYAYAGRDVYPNAWYLPGTGAQRGTILLRGGGDPLTVNYPSIDTAWYSTEEQARLPTIPVTPIGYDDAIMYLGQMAGDEVPESWTGGLDIIYRYGPGFTGTHATSKMKMHVTTKSQMRITNNVIGYIRGSVEPDRYVIIGNHRDAWVFGAMDPSSGTAVTMEVARSLGVAVKNGWKPKRSIVFCSWGAEEYGLIGSTEWVEEYTKVLGARSVAYINVDNAMTGNYTLRGRGSPSLRQAVFNAAKLVPNPNPDEVAAGRKLTYDTWLYTSEGDKPKFNTVGSGSDYTAFLQITGIAVLDFQYVFDPVSQGIPGYPVYHSVYETFDYVKTFVDPDFSYYEAIAKVTAEVARDLGDSPLLPFNAEDYAEKMSNDLRAMLDVYETELEDHEIDTDVLKAAITNFTAAAKQINERIDGLDYSDTLALRRINDQLMQLERAFIDKEGIADRETFSHVIYAPSKHNIYGAAAFPGLVDSMFEIDSAPNPEKRWNEVKRQYSILLYHIGSAASTLRDVVPIKGYSNL